jgi:hypothetical protein
VSEEKVPFLTNEKVFPSIFPHGPLTVILEDSFYTGFLIKTYYQKYRLLQGLQPVTHLIVRTTKDFWTKNIPFHGMSLFRRGEFQEHMSLTPMPPGTLYLGDPAYGKWTYDSSGQKFWKFHYAYREFPEYLGWGEWTPNYDFFDTSVLHENNNQSFLGLNKEFGIDGYISKKAFPMKLYYTPKYTLDIQFHSKKFFKVPFKKRQS